jgi:hypothetical protein
MERVGENERKGVERVLSLKGVNHLTGFYKVAE